MYELMRSKLATAALSFLGMVGSFVGAMVERSEASFLRMLKHCLVLSAMCILIQLQTTRSVTYSHCGWLSMPHVFSCFDGVIPLSLYVYIYI